MMGNAYSCLGGLNNDYGFCTPTPTTCVPYNDMCMMDQHCELVGNGQLGCVPNGMQAIGQPCGGMNGVCQRGGICVNFGDGAKCFIPCDHTNSASCQNMADSCSGEIGSGMMGFGFGVCRGGCNPLNMGTDCMAGQNCEFGGSGGQCQAEGPNMVGQPCGGMMGLCQRGGICLDFGMGGMCFSPCDPMAMQSTCAMGTMCQGLTVGNPPMPVTGWGVCN
jgi:hypothetical protein